MSGIAWHHCCSETWECRRRASVIAFIACEHRLAVVRRDAFYVELARLEMVDEARVKVDTQLSSVIDQVSRVLGIPVDDQPTTMTFEAALTWLSTFPIGDAGEALGRDDASRFLLSHCQKRLAQAFAPEHVA